jgi:hypothetical protein
MTLRRSYPVSQARVRRAPKLLTLVDAASQKASILMLATAGMDDFGIGATAGIDVGEVRRIIGEPIIGHASGAAP